MVIEEAEETRQGSGEEGSGEGEQIHGAWRRDAQTRVGHLIGGAEGSTSHRSQGEVRTAVKMHESTEGVGFFYKDGLLFRRWVPFGRDKEDMAVEQLVLPRACRGTVMGLAHSIPLAGHLGKKKTTERILQRFYWPNSSQRCG